MRHVLSMICAVLMLVSCGTQRKALNTEIRDSTRVVVRTERIETIDTVYVELPKQSETVAVKDTSSHLENDVAVSDASVDALGFLHHSLKTKPRSIPVLSKNTKERRDSIVYRDKNVYVEKPVYVEAKLNAWQRFRLNGFWILAAIVAAIGFWKFRRPLLHLLMKLIP